MKKNKQLTQAVEAKCLPPILFVCNFKSFGLASISHLNEEIFQIDEVPKEKNFEALSFFFFHTDSKVREVRR